MPASYGTVSAEFTQTEKKLYSVFILLNSYSNNVKALANTTVELVHALNELYNIKTESDGEQTKSSSQECVSAIGDTVGPLLQNLKKLFEYDIKQKMEEFQSSLAENQSKSNKITQTLRKGIMSIEQQQQMSDVASVESTTRNKEILTHKLSVFNQQKLDLVDIPVTKFLNVALSLYDRLEYNEKNNTIQQCVSTIESIKTKSSIYNSNNTTNDNTNEISAASLNNIEDILNDKFGVLYLRQYLFTQQLPQYNNVQLWIDIQQLVSSSSSSPRYSSSSSPSSSFSSFSSFASSSSCSSSSSQASRILSKYIDNDSATSLSPQTKSQMSSLLHSLSNNSTNSSNNNILLEGQKELANSLSSCIDTFKQHDIFQQLLFRMNTTTNIYALPPTFVFSPVLTSSSGNLNNLKQAQRTQSSSSSSSFSSSDAVPPPRPTTKKPKLGTIRVPQLKTLIKATEKLREKININIGNNSNNSSENNEDNFAHRLHQSVTMVDVQRALERTQNPPPPREPRGYQSMRTGALGRKDTNGGAIDISGKPMHSTEPMPVRESTRNAINDAVRSVLEQTIGSDFAKQVEFTNNNNSFNGGTFSPRRRSRSVGSQTEMNKLLTQQITTTPTATATATATTTATDNNQNSNSKIFDRRGWSRKPLPSLAPPSTATTTATPANGTTAPQTNHSKPPRPPRPSITPPPSSSSLPTMTKTPSTRDFNYNKPKPTPPVKPATVTTTATQPQQVPQPKAQLQPASRKSQPPNSIQLPSQSQQQLLQQQQSQTQLQPQQQSQPQPQQTQSPQSQQLPKALPQPPQKEVNKDNTAQSGQTDAQNIDIRVGKAVFDFQGTDINEMSLQKGEIIYIYDWSADDWWLGRVDEQRVGYFPKAFVEVVTENEL